jgi:hypothetical protein
MIDHKETAIENIIVHKIGNSKEPTILSDEEVKFDPENDEFILKSFLLKAFSSQTETYTFAHPVNLGLNPVMKCCTDIFLKQDFIKVSIDIAKYLEQASRHPNIKAGELFIARLDKVLFENKLYKAIAIIKTENKETFFEDKASASSFGVNMKNGISTAKFDKGCLVLNSDEEGYLLFVVDNNKETEYWKSIFLNVKSRSDSNNSTNNYMSLTKNFVTKHLNEKFEVSSTDKADYLNRSVEYFKTKEQFDEKQFVQEVFFHEEVIETFEKYKEQYKENNKIDLDDQFGISAQVVKKQAKLFKSVLKLDNNFHIYLHGDKELIEKGFDEEKNMNYYKVYFRSEK